MPIINSTITNKISNTTSGFPVSELHTDHNGKTYSFVYTCDGLDPYIVLAARAVNLSAEIDAKEAAEIEARNFTIPLTKYQFRQRFTQEERMACDGFNVAFESQPALTVEQKAFIRTGLEDFKAAEAVEPVKAMPLLQMYEALGLLAQGRAAEIGAS